MSELYAINVFDTTTGKERVIHVCKEVYDEFCSDNMCDESVAEKMAEFGI